MLATIPLIRTRGVQATKKVPQILMVATYTSIFRLDLSMRRRQILRVRMARLGPVSVCIFHAFHRKLTSSSQGPVTLCSIDLSPVQKVQVISTMKVVIAADRIHRRFMNEGRMVVEAHLEWVMNATYIRLFTPIPTSVQIKAFPA